MTQKTNLIEQARKDMAWLVAKENHPAMNLILDDLTEAVETTEMLLRLCECKAVGRTGHIDIAPSHDYVEVTVWADAYGLIASGKTLHAALAEALEKTGESE